MKRYLWILLASLITGSAVGQTTQPGETYTGKGVVNTQAQASTRLPNTVADVSVGVEVTGKDLDTVTQMLSRQTGSLTSYLRGLSADRLQTGEVSFEPQNHTAKSGVDSIVGYTGTASVTFRTTADKLGETLSGALSHGANRINSTSLKPREAEVEAARRTLVEEATKAALLEAEAAAKAAGEHTLAVKEITVGQSGNVVRPYPTMQFEAKARVAAAPIAIAAGDAQVSVSVSVAVWMSH